MQTFPACHNAFNLVMFSIQIYYDIMLDLAGNGILNMYMELSKFHTASHGILAGPRVGLKRLMGLKRNRREAPWAGRWPQILLALT